MATVHKNASASRAKQDSSNGVFLKDDELPPELAEWAHRSDAAYARLKRSGRLKLIEYTPDLPAVCAGRRLRRVLAAKGIKQSELARRLKISPAVISRVLKNPDRSMVATLRRIAGAIGVELYELID